jgi:hypothetical protein
VLNSPARAKQQARPVARAFALWLARFPIMSVTPENASMLRPSIRKRILGIALGLIFLMVVTSALSTVMTRKIAHQLDELTTK